MCKCLAQNKPAMHGYILRKKQKQKQNKFGLIIVYYSTTDMTS